MIAFRREAPSLQRLVLFLLILVQVFALSYVSGADAFAFAAAALGAVALVTRRQEGRFPRARWFLGGVLIFYVFSLALVLSLRPDPGVSVYIDYALGMAAAQFCVMAQVGLLFLTNDEDIPRRALVYGAFAMIYAGNFLASDERDLVFGRYAVAFVCGLAVFCAAYRRPAFVGVRRGRALKMAILGAGLASILGLSFGLGSNIRQLGSKLEDVFATWYFGWGVTKETRFPHRVNLSAVRKMKTENEDAPVLHVFSDTPPGYLRGRAYSLYSGGGWFGSGGLRGLEPADVSEAPMKPSRPKENVFKLRDSKAHSWKTMEVHRRRELGETVFTPLGATFVGAISPTLLVDQHMSLQLPPEADGEVCRVLSHIEHMPDRLIEQLRREEQRLRDMGVTPETPDSPSVARGRGRGRREAGKAEKNGEPPAPKRGGRVTAVARDTRRLDVTSTAATPRRPGQGASAVAVGDGKRGADDALTRVNRVRRRYAYLNRLAQRRYYALPDSLDPRVRRLARGLFEGRETTAEKIAAVEEYFHDNYLYRLGTRIPHFSDPINYFLMRQPPGHCELFATGAAVLLRLGGVPCRYVTGFVVNEYNPLGKYWVARYRDAHAWVEAYDDSRGWVIVEATPPEGVPGESAKGLLAQFADYLVVLFEEARLDVAEGRWERRWHEFVDGVSAVGWYLFDTAPGLTLVFLFLLLVWLSMSRPPVDASEGEGDWTTQAARGALEEFERRLIRAGLRREAHETPIQFGRRAAEALGGGEVARRLVFWTEEYARLRYSGALDAAGAERLRESIPPAPVLETTATTPHERADSD